MLHTTIYHNEVLAGMVLASYLKRKEREMGEEGRNAAARISNSNLVFMYLPRIATQSSKVAKDLQNHF